MWGAKRIPNRSIDFQKTQCTIESALINLMECNVCSAARMREEHLGFGVDFGYDHLDRKPGRPKDFGSQMQIEKEWKRQILQILFALFRFSPPLLWARLLHVSTHMNAANQLPTNPKKVVPLCLSHYSTPLLSTVVCLPRFSKLSSNLLNYCCWHLSIFVRCLGSVCEQALGPHPHAQTPQAHCAGSLNLQHCPDQLLQQNFWSWHSA